MTEELQSPKYTVDKEAYSRFDERDTVFGRKDWDEEADFYEMDMYDEIEKILSEDEEGYSRVDFARVMGAWTVYDYFHGAFSWNKLSGANNVMEKPSLSRYPIEDKSEMSDIVKKTAGWYGADLVGTTGLNMDWVYSHDSGGDRIEIPEDFKYAVVMAIEMDRGRIEESPSFAACTESALAYSKMAFCISCLAEFIRSLGYRAIPMGNDTSLSIPLAIDAGLGELGRNGLLITPEYGPCVRLCKVFTDMPLEEDEPIDLGVEEFCRDCNKCAEACEADAIQTEREPSFETVSPSNNEGIKRWAVDHDRCYRFWIDNGGDCSNCIKVCPFIE